MKAGKWIAVGILVTLSVIVVAITAGWFLLGNNFWRMRMMTGIRNEDSNRDVYACESTGYELGSGMMGRLQNYQCEITSSGSNSDVSRSELSDDCISESESKQIACPVNIILPADVTDKGSLPLNTVYEILENYLAGLDSNGLNIAEVMEFEDNFYAIVMEKESEMGAMELLVDKGQGTVFPEMGPNMIWNAKYGIHRRGMMGNRYDGVNELSEEDIISIAQDWLDNNYPGITTNDHADPFYGYYTIHTLQDGAIAGMLSVHSRTGQVWYHTWHGNFVQMIESEDTH
jgi:hypothetical protein